MKIQKKTFLLFTALATLTCGLFAKSFWSGEYYGSWGYTQSMYQRSSIHMKQSTLGNDFTLHRVSAHQRADFQFIDTDLSHISLPQYSVRIGHFFNAEKGLALELNYEHYKYLVDRDQVVHVTGKINGQAVNRPIVLDQNTLQYKLNNGANLLLLNIVKRLPLYKEPNQKHSLALLAKAGVGVMIPHVENVVFGVGKDDGFQFGGFGAGVESGIRYTPFRHLYVEFSHKFFVADYRGLHINEGTAGHTVVGQSTALAIGTMFNLP